MTPPHNSETKVINPDKWSLSIKNVVSLLFAVVCAMFWLQTQFSRMGDQLTSVQTKMDRICENMWTVSEQRAYVKGVNTWIAKGLDPKNPFPDPDDIHSDYLRKVNP